MCGSCASNDIVRTMLGPRNVKEGLKPENKFLGKVSVDSIPPGNIADRLYNDMAAQVYGPNDWPAHLKNEITLQFHNVIEYGAVNTIIDKAKRDSEGILCMDLANELLPSVITEDEQFLLKIGWPVFRQYFPKWFQDIVQNNTYHYDSYDSTMTMTRKHAITDTLDLIKDLPNVTVGIKNMYTNKIYDETTEQVIEHISLYNEKIPFLKKLHDDNEYLNFQYFKRQIDGFYRVTTGLESTSHWDWLDIEEYCYADMSHPIRLHPMHLHSTSREIAAFKLQNIINESLRKRELVGAPAR